MLFGERSTYPQLLLCDVLGSSECYPVTVLLPRLLFKLDSSARPFESLNGYGHPHWAARAELVTSTLQSMEQVAWLLQNSISHQRKMQQLQTIRHSEKTFYSECYGK